MRGYSTGCRPSAIPGRTRIALFPGQVASLQPILTDFLHASLAATRRTVGAAAPRRLLHLWHAGGTPFDRLTGTLARALGVDQTRHARPSAGAGPQLFPAPPVDRGDLRRGHAGGAQPDGRAAPAAGARCRLCCCGVACRRGDWRVVAGACCRRAVDRHDVGGSGWLRANSRWTDARSCGGR